MARYIDKLKINSTDSGKRYYNTVIPRTPRIREGSTTYTARRGDRWDLLAHKYYGRAALWYKIAIANNMADGSLFIKPGTVITIPAR